VDVDAYARAVAAAELQPPPPGGLLAEGAELAAAAELAGDGDELPPFSGLAHLASGAGTIAGGTIPPAPTVIVNASEPRPPFAVAGVELLRYETPELIAEYGADEIRVGYYPRPAAVKEPTRQQIAEVTTGRRKLLAMIPAQVFRRQPSGGGNIVAVDPGPLYAGDVCAWCDRVGFVPELHRNEGQPICPPCVARLIGRTFAGAILPRPAQQAHQAEGASAEAHAGDQAGDQAEADAGDQAGASATIAPNDAPQLGV
jgi:hypothetical protein